MKFNICELTYISIEWVKIYLYGNYFEKFMWTVYTKKTKS